MKKYLITILFGAFLLLSVIILPSKFLSRYSEVYGSMYLRYIDSPVLLIFVYLLVFSIIFLIYYIIFIRRFSLKEFFRYFLSFGVGLLLGILILVLIFFISFNPGF